MITIVLTNYAIAQQVLSGQWGNGEERKQRLTEAGYDYTAVQSIVNALVKDSSYKPAEMLESKQEPEKPLEIDYDPEQNDGIIINIII